MYAGKSMRFFERRSILHMTLRGYYRHAVFADPLFKDAKKRDFTLALNSPALATGFVPWNYQAGTKTLFGAP